MKLKKKSGIIGAIAVLTGVSVVSVGFASWVISGGETKTVEGNISVETVSDARYHIATADDGDSIKAPEVTYGSGTAVAFGYNTNGIVNTKPWLLSNRGSGSVAENFHAKATFWVANLGTGDEDKLSYTLALSNVADNSAVTTANGKFGDAVTATYIKALPTGAQDGGDDGTVDATIAITSDTATHSSDKLVYRKVEITLDSYFGWGAYFTLTKGTNPGDGISGDSDIIVNPSRFFNDKVASWDNSTPTYVTAETAIKNPSVSTATTWGDEAAGVLKAIEACAGAKFGLTLTTHA